MRGPFARSVIAALALAAVACARDPESGPAPDTETADARVEPIAIPIGPAAPAPDAVAIIRPTEDERREVNDALQQIIDDRSQAHPLLRKYESLVLLPPARSNLAATFTPGVHRLGARHDAFVAIAKRGNIDLLLHGDSITDWWQLESNKPVFDRYFGHIRTANFAVAGDTTESVLWGLRNGEGQGFQPRAVMLLIGINNIGAFSAPEVAEGIGAIVLELRRNFPAAKILLLGLFPYGVASDPIRGKIADVNRIISTLDDRRNVFYMDIGDRFLDTHGAFLPGVFQPDNLHPQTRGYEIWGDAVSSTLAELLR